MKTFDQIKKLGRIVFVAVADDGGMGYIPGLDRKKPNKMACVVWSIGCGWDHVSVSFKDRCPTWDEMCCVKDMFFDPEECCIEYHPAKSEYVNNFENCLHIWRPQDQAIPLPPSWMVGFKDGQDKDECLMIADSAMREWEENRK